MKLEDVRFETPCRIPWSGMKGDDKVRLCATCDRNVYNLSAMTREEAEKFLDEHRGAECVMLWKRPDGRIVTTDCGNEYRGPRRQEPKGRMVPDDDPRLDL